MKNLSKFLEQKRHSLKITQRELSKKIGISEDGVAKHERGDRRPKLEHLLKYSRIYHVSIYKLVDLEIKDIKEERR